MSKGTSPEEGRGAGGFVGAGVSGVLLWGEGGAEWMGRWGREHVEGSAGGGEGHPGWFGPISVCGAEVMSWARALHLQNHLLFEILH